MYNQQQLSREVSLADELGGGGGGNSSGPSSLLVLKCGYLWDNDSPDSDRLLTDADSGHSTAHSPTDGPKSMSPIFSTPSACVRGGTPYSDVEVLEATHRSLHKFIPRHDDEIELEIGDPIYVQKEADDLWCEGMNCIMCYGSTNFSLSCCISYVSGITRRTTLSASSARWLEMSTNLKLLVRFDLTLK